MSKVLNDHSKGGSLKISHDVVASIAGLAATEVEGVSCLAPMSYNSLTGWFLEKQTVRPISIDISDGVAVIDIRLRINSGVKIPELCKKVQAAVKESVQNMTGMIVSKVNLHIAGISFFEDAAG